MKVFKFGGASVNSVERIRNLAQILRDSNGDKKLIVISAMGKMTNALEKVVDAFYHQQKKEAERLFGAIKEEHLDMARQLIKQYPQTEKKLVDFFTEIEWLLHDQPKREYDYYYDQIVCVGELLSTAIVSDYLNETGISNFWFDVRDIFRTDDNYRDANINWAFTQGRINEMVRPLFENHAILLTQGFIGSTSENESTTLGREGSDYSAAVFANMLDAESQTIWKDVSGVMNADPKEFPKAQLIPELNYDEVIEMAYYGAQVIHPKTIKPLQNKSIPLYVKCFLDRQLPGTIIHDGNIRGLPSIIVRKRNQVLMHLHSKDFSFVGERPTGELYHLFAELNIKPNLMQSGAVTLQVCLDDRADKIEKLALRASEIFDVQAEKGLVLLTIRHYDQKTVDELIAGKKILLSQQSAETTQFLMREN
ncbi:MAG: aspartate kinase [Chitinophagales bacterium]